MKRPRTRLLAFAACSALLLGCSSQEDPAKKSLPLPSSPTASDGTSPSPTDHGTASPIGPTISPDTPMPDGGDAGSPTDPDTSPDTDPTPKPKPPGPLPPTSVLVSGPTPSNDFPADWGVFPDPGVQCTHLSYVDEDDSVDLGLDIPLTIRSVRTSGAFKPANAPGNCGQRSASSAPACTVGFKFLPSPVSRSCRIAVALPRSADDVDHFHEALSVELAGECTTRSGLVCARLPSNVRVDRGNPVPVKFVFHQRLRACLKSVPVPFSPNGDELFSMTDEECVFHPEWGQ